MAQGRASASVDGWRAGSDVAGVAQYWHETPARIGTIRGKVWKGEYFPAGSWLRTGTDSAPARPIRGSSGIRASNETGKLVVAIHDDGLSPD